MKVQEWLKELERDKLDAVVKTSGHQENVLADPKSMLAPDTRLVVECTFCDSLINHSIIVIL